MAPGKTGISKCDRDGFERSGKVGQVLAPGIGLKAAHRCGRQLHGFAQLARRFPTSTRPRAAVGGNGTGNIKVMEHILAGIKAGLKVGCRGGDLN